MLIVLDTFPVSCTAKSPGLPPTLSDRCRDWILRCEEDGHRIVVPGICYYEALRELERREAHSQIERLRDFCLQPSRFIPITRLHLDTAARLWGQSRRDGLPTADPHALDGDLILCAQVLDLGLDSSRYIVATTNVRHLSGFVACDHWENI